MAEILNEEDEVKLKIRLRSQRHIRIILIILNLLLVGYLIYFTSDSIVKSFEKKDAGIVALNDLSKSKSKEKYEELSDGKYVTMGDYALYGHYLHFSESKFDVRTYSPLGEFYLVHTDNGAEVLMSTESNLDKGLDLSSLTENDYLVKYNDGIIKVVLGKENYEETIYTLPLNKEGLRKKITLYAYPENPAFVIKVRDVYDLPGDHYDVILKAEGLVKDSLISLFEDEGEFSSLNVKWVNGDENLANVYSVSSNVAINLCNIDSEKEGVICSNFINGEDSFIKDELLIDTSLIGLDKTPFIRELGGYVFQSGSRNKDVPGTFDVVNVLGTHDAGKMAFEIYASEIESFTSYLTSVLNYIK